MIPCELHTGQIYVTIRFIFKVQCSKKFFLSRKVMNIDFEYFDE